MLGMGKEQSKLKYVSEVPLTDYHIEPLVESQNTVQVSAKSYILARCLLNLLHITLKIFINRTTIVTQF